LSHMLFAFSPAILLLSGCDSAQDKLKEKEMASAAQYKRCRELDAKISGIDMEIGLHFNEAYDVKWRAQAFGGVGPSLFEAAQQHKSQIIKLRGQRQEHYSLAQAEGCTTHPPYVKDENWDQYKIVNDKITAVRDPSKPEGYGLLEELPEHHGQGRMPPHGPVVKSVEEVRHQRKPTCGPTLEELDAEIARRAAAKAEGSKK
jgi:hypothetical protein